MNEYRTADYGDPVLNRAARARYRHLKVVSELTPFDSCDVLTGWSKAGWPTDYAPPGALGDSVRGIYYPDLQLPTRPRWSGGCASSERARSSSRESAIPRSPSACSTPGTRRSAPLFPLASKKWLQWR